MKVSVIFLVVLFQNINASSLYDCLETGAAFYEELGCEAIKSDNNTCPSAYKCLQQKENKCIFRERYYNHGEDIKDITLCKLRCKCFIQDIYSHVLCENIKCPYLELEPDCFTVFEKPENCCPTTKICPPFDITCNVDGKIYKEGEKFSSEDSCFDCICKPSFNGTYEPPYCTRKIHGLQVYHQENIKNNCVPVYLSSLGEPLCLPNSYICTEDTIKVDIIKKVVNKDNDPLCVFDDRKYSKGDLLKVTSGEWPFTVEYFCSCLLPPYLSCSDSYNKNFLVYITQYFYPNLVF